MRYFLSLFATGIAGGLVVLAGVFWLSPNEEQFVQASEPAFEARQVHQPLVAVDEVPSFVEAAQKAVPSVVYIYAESTKKSRRSSDEIKRGSGSGVIYTSDGYIVTNEHVVGFADLIEVTLLDRRKFTAELVGSYPKADLAVLKIEAEDLPVLDIADSDAAQIGEWVLAIGNPFGLTSTVTAGIVSAKGRNIDIIEGQDAIESFIQTDAAVNPGNSGGALINTAGELLGINTAITTHTGFYEGYSFSIPSALVQRVADDIINYGHYRRPYLGIVIRDLEEDDLEELQLDITQGIRVLDTEKDGSAAEAGLQEDDVIIMVDDRRIYSVPDLQEAIGRARVGDVLKVEFYRNGNKMELEVKLKAGEEEEEEE
ncbi:MAG TPA: PDZ domain-containing protein [Phaeodactylibacter sp.]|nr:PDZ domain-containing protein [Phaeodactylibacter sp.]